MDEILRVRISKEQKEYIKNRNETISDIIRIGIQLYFDNVANCECKKKGNKVWNEYRSK